MTEPRPGSALERLRQLEASRARPAPDPQAGARQAGDRQPDAPRRAAPAGRGAKGALALLALVLWKFKAVLLLVLSKLKLLLVGLKLLKFGKLLTTGWTMLLSMWVYSMYFGAPFAIGFVLLILVHELGHGLAARLIGLPVGAPIFIPFFGAMIALKQAPRTTFQDFVIGVGGPLAGSLGGLACLGLAHVVGGHWGQLLHVLAYFTFVINLFNLIPVWQLDGARIAAPFHTSMWALAVAVLGLVTLAVSGATGELNPLPLLLVLAAGYRLVRSWWLQREARRSEPVTALGQLAALRRHTVAARDLDVTGRQRWIAWLSYVGLAAGLIALVHHLAAGLPVVEG